MIVVSKCLFGSVSSRGLQLAARARAVVGGAWHAHALAAVAAGAAALLERLGARREQLPSTALHAAVTPHIN